MSPDTQIPEVKLPTLRFPDLTCDDIFRLETKRLWLRWPRATDAAALTAFASLAEVARMTANIPHPYPPREADRFILTTRAENAVGAALHLAITQKTGVRPVIGLVSVALTETSEAEIGYVLKPEAWGKGYASEAVRLMIDTAFNLTRNAPHPCEFAARQFRLAPGTGKGRLHLCRHRARPAPGARRPAQLRPFPARAGGLAAHEPWAAHAAHGPAAIRCDPRGIGNCSCINLRVTLSIAAM